MEKQNLNPIIPIPLNFLFGGLAGVGASFFIQPMDLIKSRMQVNKNRSSILGTLKQIQQEGRGIFGLYEGLTAGMMRKAIYTTVRLGSFDTSLDIYRIKFNEEPKFSTKALLGSLSGGIGGFFGTPAEVALIRMTVDKALPIEDRRNYTHVINAFLRIAKEEGIFKGLWKGANVTVTRAIVANGTQLSCYTETKHQLLKTKYFKDDIKCHLVSSMIAGFATAFITMPFDIIKTTIQNMKLINGVPEFKGQLGIARHILTQKNIFAFWKGFIPYYARIGTATVLVFIFLEQIKLFYLEKVKDF